MTLAAAAAHACAPAVLATATAASLVLSSGAVRALVVLGLCVLLVFLALAWLVRGSLAQPLARLEQRVRAMAGGELQRPVALAAVAPAELAQLVQALEEVRRSLLTRLRSSTELNLQLESEVARRTVELSRRNQELTDALARLSDARAELVRREKLAAVGRVAARLTSEIVTPVSSLVALPEPLAESLAELGAALDDADALAAAEASPGVLAPRPDPLARAAALERAATALAELHEMLSIVLRSAQRARDVVRAMRAYARPGAEPRPQTPGVPLGEIAAIER